MLILIQGSCTELHNEYYEFMNMQLTDSEANSLFQILDIALKSEGIKLMNNVNVFSEKIKRAVLEEKKAEEKKAEEEKAEEELKGKEPKK